MVDFVFGFFKTDCVTEVGARMFVSMGVTYRESSTTAPGGPVK